MHIKKPVASFNSLAKVVLRWLKSLIGFLGLQWWCYRGKLNSLLAINDVSCTFSGFTFCKAMQLNMSIYMAGTIIWSCLTALTRVLYIKVTSWVRFRIGETWLLLLLLSSGLVLTATFAVLGTYSDEDSQTVMICNHHGRTYAQVLRDYQVENTSQKENFLIMMSFPLGGNLKFSAP